MALTDEDRAEIAGLIDAGCGELMNKSLAGISDTLKKVTDACSAMSERMDGMDQSRRDAADLGKRIDALSKSTAKKDEDEGDDGFDDLPETTREGQISEAMKDFSDREPGEAKQLAADSARTRYDEAVKRESVHDRERRHQSLRADAWAVADDIFNALGVRAPKPMSEEAPRAYRCRLLRQIQRYSPAFKNIDLGAISDPKLFAVAESTVYADARREGVRPTDVGPGRLRMITKRGPGGHTINEFHGSPSAWMNDLAGPVQLRGTGNFLVPNYRGQ